MTTEAKAETKIHYEQPPLRGAAPRNSFTFPRDALRKLGGGDIAIGHAVLLDLLHTHVMSGPLGTISPDAVREVGGGDINAGRKVLQRLVTMLRAKR